MKAKYVLLAILLTTLLVTPAFGFWHPPPEEPPPCPYFGVMINGEWSTSAAPYELVEPETGFCDDITVEVWIANVEDLYGYEFKLTWDTTYFALKSWKVEQVWPSQWVVKPDATYTGTSPYHQAVAAVAPSTGVSGNILLATLTFHIVNDVCWLQGNLTKTFKLKDMKASDSCSQEIDLCNPKHGYVKLVPVQPKIYMDPAEEINWIVGDKFTLTIWVENIVKMNDIYLWIQWNGKYHPEEGGFWTAILFTKKADIVINQDVFPADKQEILTLNVVSPACGAYPADPVGHVELYIKMKDPPAFPLINGTFWVMKITFTKCDPWYCGRQPDYTALEDHEWVCENATTPIYFVDGYISVKCPDPACMGIGADWNGDGLIDVAKEEAKFTFLPIPGDLDGNGHVDIQDLTIITKYYGLTWPPCDPPYYDYYYDLNKDGIIDVFDIVIVAKNFCRTEP